MTRKIFFLILTLVSFFLSCRQRNIIERKPILNDKKLHVGDSILENGLLTKIIFSDSSLLVDSIVYTRFSNSSKSIKAINTYIKGKKAFENIEYNDNGEIKSYQFLDNDCENCFYKRDYDSSGNLISTNGKYLFQCNADKIDLATLSIKKGTTINLNLFYANPPDCKTLTYVRFTGNKKKDIFYQNEQISFLKTVAVDNNDYDENKHWRQIEIGIEIKDNKTNKVDTSSQSLFYKVTN
jgi:hypothetical protein